MNTCDTCKWWGFGSETNYGEGFRVKDMHGWCENPKVNGQTDLFLRFPNGQYRSYGTCAVPMDCSGESTDKHLHEGWIEREDSHSIPLDEANPDSSDTFGICFRTGPKFGCIHHQPK